MRYVIYSIQSCCERNLWVTDWCYPIRWTHPRTQSWVCLCDITRLHIRKGRAISNSPHKLSSPENNSLSKWDISVPRVRTFSVEPSRWFCSWMDYKFEQRCSALGVRFGRGGYRTHLPNSWWVDNHQTASKSRTDFWWSRISSLPSSKPISAFRNATWSRVPRDPCRPRLVEVIKSWPLHYIISKNTIVTGTCWISPARPLSTITLVTHPRGEEHELAISPNY